MSFNSNTTDVTSVVLIIVCIGEDVSKLWNLCPIRLFLIEQYNMFKVLVGQELPTLPEHPSSPWLLVGFVLVDVTFSRSSLLIDVCPFVIFLLAIAFSVLRFTEANYPVVIFKLLSW